MSLQCKAAGFGGLSRTTYIHGNQNAFIEGRTIFSPSQFPQSQNYFSCTLALHSGKIALWQHRITQMAVMRYLRAVKMFTLEIEAVSAKAGTHEEVLIRTLPKHPELSKRCISPNHSLQPQSKCNSCPLHERA